VIALFEAAIVGLLLVVVAIFFHPVSHLMTAFQAGVIVLLAMIFTVLVVKL